MSHAAPQASSALGRRIGALDGIRAFAVLAVFFFHNGVSWMPGGFLGVDTFFVLSGYLITTLLVREADRTGRIDLWRFWARRLRRLLPALLLVVVTVAIVLAAAGAGAYVAYRDDAFATLAYVANWRLAFGSTGYFAQYAVVSPLQHTWSLAVEEQFYVLWPLVVILAVRWWGGARRLLVPVLAVAALSAAAMAYLFSPGNDPSRLYYGSDTRAHSLLIGVLLALALARWGDTVQRAADRRPGVAVAVAMLAFAATAIGWATIDGTTAFVYRGGMAGMSLASALIVACVVLAPRGAHSRVLGLLPLVALGRVSYGFYLWHWPVQLAMTAGRTGLYGAELIGARLVVTIALATVSWWLVERPILTRTRITWRIAPSFAVATAVACAVVVAANASVPPTSSPAAASASVDSEVAPAEPAPTKLRVAVLGDSVADSLARGLAPVDGRYRLAVSNGGIIGCGVATTPEYRLAGTVERLADTCKNWKATWGSTIRSSDADLALLVLGRHEIWDGRYQGAWTHIGDPAYDGYLRAQLEEAIRVAGAGGAHVVLATSPYYQRPEQPNGRPWPENQPKRVDAFNALVREVAAAEPDVSVIDLGGHLSPDGSYTTSIDGIAVRSDGVHFTTAGVRWLAPWLATQLRAADPAS